MVPHHSTDYAINCLTAQIGRDAVGLVVYGRNLKVRVLASNLYWSTGKMGNIVLVHSLTHTHTQKKNSLTHTHTHTHTHTYIHTYTLHTRTPQKKKKKLFSILHPPQAWAMGRQPWWGAAHKKKKKKNFLPPSSSMGMGMGGVVLHTQKKFFFFFSSPSSLKHGAAFGAGIFQAWLSGIWGVQDSSLFTQLDSQFYF